MNKYWAHTGTLAEATPASRNRTVDFWRVVAILVVMLGHWLAASIWLKPGGDIALLNSLEWIPWSGWLTWVVQVMPIFFLAGGYANARGLDKVVTPPPPLAGLERSPGQPVPFSFLAGGYANARGLGKVERGEEVRREWITARVRRMFTPVIPLLLVWVLLIIVMRAFVPPEVVYAGAMSATVPLWFLAVYLTLTALAPLTYVWWRRFGVATIVALAAAAIAIDVARFVFDVPGIGWANFVFVWATVHQLGYWWSERDREGGLASSTGWGVFGGSLALLIALTWTGLYPVAMVGVPGAGVTNMTPPTFAMAVLGLMQLGIIWGTQPAVRRFTARARAWHGVVAISGIIMTIYLWHLSAMSLVAAGGLFTFDGAFFKIEPGTVAWWATRPVWIAVLLTMTGILVTIFARFEWRISDAPAPETRRVVTVGVLLTAGSAAAVATTGITTPDAVVQWSIPAAAIAGAAMLGALPSRRRGH